MRIALIVPKGVLFGSEKRTEAFFRKILSETASDPLVPRYSSWSGGSLGLLIVAALTPPDVHVDYYDENYEPLDLTATYDLVAISLMTQQATRAYQIADAFRSRGIPVVLGGIHATVMPHEAKEHADAVVIGEAENTWPVLIEDHRAGTMRQFYRSPGPFDLRMSPIPRYDLLKKYDYKMIWVQTTRGCPRDCEFCNATNVFGKILRHKTIEQVIAEIRYIKELWKQPFLHFADDNMFVDKSYSRELVGALSGQKVKWTAQSDFGVSEDEAFLDQLRSSGCRVLFIGFETLTKENMLDRHGWKRGHIESFPKIIDRIQSHGIGVLGAFIVGLDQDDRTVFDQLHDFITGSNLYAAQITVLTPLPGTRLRARLEKESRVLPHPWERYTMVDVNFLPKRMTAEELQSGIKDLYQRIYRKDTRAAVMGHFRGIYRRLHEKLKVV